MNAEQRYQVFQIKPGKPQPVFIDPDDPKGIKGIQEILANEGRNCRLCHLELSSKQEKERGYCEDCQRDIALDQSEKGCGG